MDAVNCFVSSDLSGTSYSVWLGHNPLSSSFILLSAQLVLALTITHVLYFLLKPFKQPRVVSDIMALVSSVLPNE
ncbi:hypothetical protein ACMD2_12004 [Ananas comosus]|uniref:Uncharacterized protein n=1 Tax=Ananas comosus TaxID=4615 RepID=A0A199UWP2_ANACO|nr:hypothetical protein ACMD2_12004 [Ananas comosus]